MIGWDVSVYRQADGGTSPAKVGSKPGVLVATWRTCGFKGLEWIDALVEAGLAIHLGGGGYPKTYTVQAGHLIPTVVNGPPEIRTAFSRGQDNAITSQPEGKPSIDHDVADDCRPEEWLIVEAWDQS